MGCAYSHNGSNIFKKINDNNILMPSNKMFKVINIDEQGNDVSLGKIEVSYNELILHQKNKTSTKWPLRSLRRYGHDLHLFSFECGRRCSTGPGVYAFKCNQAEELFNVLRIAIENSTSNIFEEPHTTNQSQKNLNFSGLKSISQNFVNQSSNKLTNLKLNPQFIADNETGSKSHDNVSIFPQSHVYANDIREYINSPIYVNTQNSMLNFNEDLNKVLKSNDNNLRKTNINFNYAKLEDLQSYVNLNKKSNCIYVNQQNESVQSVKLCNDNEDKEKHKLNYTTLDLDNNYDNIINKLTSETVKSTTDNGKFNEFNNNTNSNKELTGALSYDENKPTPNVQPYSVIDFNKTKALSNSAAVHRKELVH